MEEEKNTDGERKTSPSLPANYISIIQLQERWFNEKERKQKEEEEEERRRKQQQIEEQRVIEEDDPKKPEVRKPHEDFSENRKKKFSGNRKKKGSIGAEWFVKEQPDATAAIGSARGENAVPIEHGLPEKKRRPCRKRYKKKYKDAVAVVEEKVVECELIAKPPVKKTEAKPTEKIGVEIREKAVTAVESQFKDLSIDKDQGSGSMKQQSRSSNRNRPSPRHVPQRVRSPVETATMVWVKKGDNQRASDGIGNGAKPSNA